MTNLPEDAATAVPEDISEIAPETDDLAAIAASFAEGEVPTMTHTILEVWRELLSNVESEAEAKIPMGLAHNVVSRWTRLDYSNVPAYYDLYFSILVKARDLLDDIIATDKEALERVENDAIENGDLYREVIFAWNDLIQQWEEEWDTMSPLAATSLAAQVDAAAFLVGQTGLLEQLGQPQIGFQFTEEDQEALHARLRAAAEGRVQ